jgi:hypothetical protein
MKNLTWNAIKTAAGFVIGTLLLAALHGVHPVLVSAVQMLVFTLFYAACDHVRARVMRAGVINITTNNNVNAHDTRND